MLAGRTRPLRKTIDSSIGPGSQACLRLLTAVPLTLVRGATLGFGPKQLAGCPLRRDPFNVFKALFNNELRE